MSAAFRKIAEIQAMLDQLRASVADAGERLDRIEKEDRKRAAMQKFIESVPINGAQHIGLNGINWKG